MNLWAPSVMRKATLQISCLAVALFIDKRFADFNPTLEGALGIASNTGIADVREQADSQGNLLQTRH